MFDGKGRTFFAALLVLALAVPALGVLAAGSTEVATTASLVYRTASLVAPQAAAPAAGELTWTQVHQAPAGQHFYGLTFPTRDVGYAVSGPDWNVNNGSGAPTYISKTIDGGKTWTSTAIAGTDGWMRGVTCTDANNCWVAGKAKGRILRTTDGGVTWKAMTNSSGYPNWLWSAGWTGKGTTILAGTTCYDPADSAAVANWLRSTDGQIFRGVVGQPGVYNCAVQWDIECPAAGTCFSIGKDIMWRSTNDGANWTRTSPGTTRWYGLSCTSASNCWISGKFPHIKSTGSGGSGWTGAAVAGIGSGALLWDIDMTQAESGYAVGCSSSEGGTDRCLGQGVIYRSEDGLTWLPIPSPTTADIMDVWVFDLGDVFIIDWSGKIWHGTAAPPPTPTPTATATPSTGFVSGFAFDDRDGDVFKGQDEPGLAGATLVLRQGRTEITTLVTETDGSFRFTGIQPGQYTLQGKAPPPGFEPSLFLGTFELGANRELTFYLPYSAALATLTATPSQTPEESQTPTPTATRTPFAGGTPAYLPLITK